MGFVFCAAADRVHSAHLHAPSLMFRRTINAHDLESEYARRVIALGIDDEEFLC
tara:strand:+ start:735 stop:896 length:162 start_codon:yes stop_codon:yes gene_type:complete